MTTQLEKIRFEIEEARREGRIRESRLIEQIKREGVHFTIQMIVTSLAGVVAAAVLILHLLGRV